jgi:kinesin family protein 4/21/27
MSPHIPVSTVPSVHIERSVGSLEKEIMRLQEVLKEREAEIAILEQSLNDRDGTTALTSPIAKPTEKSLEMNGKASALDTALMSTTLSGFDLIHENGNGSSCHDTGQAVSTPSFSERDESLERLNELML